MSPLVAIAAAHVRYWWGRWRRDVHFWRDRWDDFLEAVRDG